MFKNKKSGVTFHPKIYMGEDVDSAEIFVGSNNLTDGGLFSNYEGTAHVSYSLPKDNEKFESAKSELNKFLEPTDSIAKCLNKSYLAKLLAKDDIPSDAEAKKRRKDASVGINSRIATDDTFGFEATLGRDPLPILYQNNVIAINSNQMAVIKANKSKKAAGKEKVGTAATAALGVGEGGLLSVKPLAQLVTPTAFYMELNATKGARAA